MTFKEKLVKLRKLKGLTQDEFASAVGVSRQAVYKWESGQSYPEVPKLLEIKLLFGISIDDLLDESYEVVLPERKRRRRISEDAKRRIEAEVRREEGAVEAVSVEAPVVEAAPAAEVTEDVAPIAEEPAVEAAVEEAVAVAAPVAESVAEESVAIVSAETTEAAEVESAPVEDEPAEVAVESAPQKKKTLFARLFGKK